MNEKKHISLALVMAFKKGDLSAIDTIYEMHYSQVFYFARNLVKTKEDAEDIAIEVFLSLINKKESFDDLSKIQAFLWTATKNACINFLKQNKRRSELRQEMSYFIEKEDDYIINQFHEAMVFETILKEVEHLSPKQQEIFKMTFVDGMGTDEVAEALNITMDTVRVQKARAIHTLREIFSKNKDELFSIAFPVAMGLKILSENCAAAF